MGFKPGDRVIITTSAIATCNTPWYSKGAVGTVDEIPARTKNCAWVKFDEDSQDLIEPCKDNTWCVKNTHMKLLEEEN